MRLELSSEGRYALRALVYLARVGARVSADTIATKAHVPRRLLARVMARLAGAGLVESVAGRGGGSRLARPADLITLREAVEAAEGPFGVTTCIMMDRTCGQDTPCALHAAWKDAQQAILERLETQTLAGFVAQTVLAGEDREAPGV